MPSLSSLSQHPYLLAALGGAVGSVGRIMITNFVTRWTGDEFPFGTLVVNVTGAVLMGLLAGFSDTEPGRLLFAPPTRTFVMIGVLGGYTTFSSFSLQTFLLLEQGNIMGAVLNASLSVLLCLLGIWLGFTAVRAF